ncbi:MAG: hypothetical protein E5Y77_07210 [Mesorhizobium sp.]|nr:MAG: hypothetical protein E5Y77_07210 [Mesorhizobium sp.]
MTAPTITLFAELDAHNSINFRPQRSAHGGQKKQSRRFFTPPSVLPDISPTRGGDRPSSRPSPIAGTQKSPADPYAAASRLALPPAAVVSTQTARSCA